MVEQSLIDIYGGVSHLSDKGTDHSYIEVYDVLLTPYRRCSQAVLEVGVWSGGSLYMWERYFPFSKVVGVDVGYDRKWGSPPIPSDSSLPPRVSVVMGDSTDPMITERLAAHAPYQVIIDDGSHRLGDQLATFRNLRPLLSSGGMYIIEDVGSRIVDQVGTVLEHLGVSECVDQIRSQEPGFRLFDLRATKGKYNDVLMVYRAPG